MWFAQLVITSKAKINVFKRSLHFAGLLIASGADNQCNFYFPKFALFLRNSRALYPVIFLMVVNGCADSQNDQFVLSLIGMVMTFLHFGKHYN